MQSDESISQAREAIGRLVNLDVNALVRREELGKAFSFEPATELFVRYKDIGRLLSDLQLSDLSERQFSTVINCVNQLNGGLDRVRGFSPQEQEAAMVKQRLINDLQTSLEQVLEKLSPIFAYFSFVSLCKVEPDALVKRAQEGSGLLIEERFRILSANIEKTLQATTEAFEKSTAEGRTQLRGVLGTAKAEAAAVEEMAKEVKGVLKAAKEAGAKVGVVKHATLFSEEAKKHSKAAYIWLGFLVLLAGITVWLACHWLDICMQDQVPITLPKALQIIVPRLVILSILYWAILWCGRNFKAHRHNYVVNRHRFNALTSFETFVNGASDEATKNAVLIQATRSIFAFQPSGFGGKEPDLAPGGAQIVEIVKSAAEPAKKGAQT